jgi:glycosyltransferase involved in cell wall biosynthesis
VTPGLVSTIIPVYNRAALVREAVESVLAQTYRPVEIVIVDDGSTDETPGVLATLAATHSSVVRIVTQPNRGPGLAREAGRQVARGEFIQYLDSDDLLLPSKFELQVSGLREHPECGISYGMSQIREIDGTTRGPSKQTGSALPTLFPAVLRARLWDTSTPLFRKAATVSWSDLRLEEDWEHDCRLGVLGIRLHHVPQYVSVARNHSGPKLAVGDARDPARMRERARAHVMIHGHATRAGIGSEVPEMQHFARELFLLARQCGALGLAAESKTLFDLARLSSTPERRNGIDFRLYGLVARVFGWGTAGRIAGGLDLMRSRQ